MTNDEKIDAIYKSTIKMEVRLNNVCDTVDKHDTEIYGNGKDGLKTSVSLLEDNLAGIPKVKSRTAIMWWALSILSSSTVLGFAIYVIRKI